MLLHYKSLSFAVYLDSIGPPGDKIRPQNYILFEEAINLGAYFIFSSLHRNLDSYCVSRAAGLDFTEGCASITQSALDINEDLRRSTFRNSNAYLMNRRISYL